MSVHEFMTGGEINGILNGKAHIVPYSELSKFKTIEELLGSQGHAVILYEVKPGVGHWTCVFYGPPLDECDLDYPRIYFFDSYGIKPDDEQEWIDVEFRKKAWDDMRVLSKLLKNTPSEINYNEFQLQEMKSGVNTCGKWCVARLGLKHLDDEEFAELFAKEDPTDTLSPDQLVAYFVDGLKDKGQSSRNPNPI
jgi:hypothetical protein